MIVLYIPILYRFYVVHVNKTLPPNPAKIKRKTYGTLVLKLKAVNKYPLPIFISKKDQVRVKFLGEVGGGTLLRPANATVMDFLPSTVTYKIETRLP